MASRPIDPPPRTVVTGVTSRSLTRAFYQSFEQEAIRRTFRLTLSRCLPSR